MKTWIAFIIALLLVCGINFYLGALYTKHYLPDRVLSQNLETMQDADAKETRAAVHAIQMLDAGQSDEAIRILTRPIAHYYGHYRPLSEKADPAHHSAPKDLQLQILQLAQSNRIVALGLTNKTSLYLTPTNR